MFPRKSALFTAVQLVIFLVLLKAIALDIVRIEILKVYEELLPDTWRR
jgi:hypothetical protein